ncbi:BLOC-1 related complex subunit 7 isoform X2 [Rhodnius prolixus]|uniref:BLOC-1 related complex subunit 7 isoform X2 n=1 Tax=Rhodnius prolixus TaxID=13249 RepID=UPI003D18F572
MASASSTSAKSLFAESKSRLADRVQNNVNNIASLARQVQRGSKTSEIMMSSARSFAGQEHVIVNTENLFLETKSQSSILMFYWLAEVHFSSLLQIH